MGGVGSARGGRGGGGGGQSSRQSSAGGGGMSTTLQHLAPLAPPQMETRYNAGSSFDDAYPGAPPDALIRPEMDVSQRTQVPDNMKGIIQDQSFAYPDDDFDDVPRSHSAAIQGSGGGGVASGMRSARRAGSGNPASSSSSTRRTSGSSAARPVIKFGFSLYSSILFSILISLSLFSYLSSSLSILLPISSSPSPSIPSSQQISSSRPDPCVEKILPNKSPPSLRHALHLHIY